MSDNQILNNQILLTPTQARKFLGVGKNEIYKLCNTKGFPSFRIGSKHYINKDKLQSWCDSKCK